MPRINRVRVNNINYNDGTQRYDDFIMNFNGKNSLYDLVNGGGKSILLMMLMQTVLPNQELDKKQPVSKLFKTSNNNTTIHSMVEWILDKEAATRFQAKYLLAGFCAKKGSEGKGEVEYFNYAITYTKYNDYDIKNFSLLEGNEKVNYSGLRKKLRQLQELNLLDCRVTMFETNDEYKKFLTSFGIYESHWNIIRGINVSEGRVRTYIEENYKTTRKLVDKLLIEEIIEKANSLKNGNYDEDLAKSLLDIEGKLTELSKKKQDIDKYKNQVLALEQFINRVSDYVKALEEKDSIKKDYVSLFKMIYNNHLFINKQYEEIVAELSKEQGNLKYEEQYIDALLIKREEERINLVAKELTNLKEEVNNVKAYKENIKKEVNYKEALKYYLDYKDNKSKHTQILSEIKQIGEDSKEKLERIQKLVYYKKQYIDILLEKLSKDKEEVICKREEYLLNQKKLNKDQIDGNIELGRVGALLESEEEGISRLNASINKLNQKILKDSTQLPESYPLLRDEEVIVKYEEDLNEVKRMIDSLNESLKSNTDKIQMYETKLQVNVALRPNLEQRVKELNTFFKEYHEKLARVTDIKKILQQEENKQLESILDYLQAKIEDNKKNQYLKEQNYHVYQKYYKGLLNGTLFVENKDLQLVYEYLTSKSSHVELGTDFIKDLSKADKEEILKRIPFIPYAIIVEDNFYKQIRKQLKFDWLNLNSLVPIVSTKAIREGYSQHEEADTVFYLQNKVELYSNEDYIEEEKIRLTKELTKLEKELKEHEDNIKTYQEFYHYLKDFNKDYQIKLNKNERILKEWEKEISKLDESDQQIHAELEVLNTSLLEGRNHLSELMENTITYGTLIDSLNQRIELNNKLDESNLLLRQFEIKSNNMKLQLDKINQNLLETSHNIHLNNIEINGIEDKVNALNLEWQNKYYSYYVDGLLYEPCKDSEESVSIELNAAIKTYEEENHDLKGKKEILKVYEKGMLDTLREIENREFSINFFIEKEAVAGYLHIHENEIKIGKEHLKEAERNLELLNQSFIEKKSEYDNLSGKITLMKDTFASKYKLEITLDDTELSDIANALTKHKNKKQVLADYLRELARKESETSSEKKKMESVLEKGKTYAETLSIAITYEDLHSTVVISTSKLSNSLNSLLQKIQDNTVTGNERYKLCLKAKEKCVKDITVHNYMYGDELNKCVIPQDYQEANKFKQDLNKSKDFFVEEIERIDEGLKEILEIKDRFNQKCLQKSQAIKADLEKFAKFSKMYMDNEEIQAVKLKISYLPEDIRKNKMEQYIERIVYEVCSMKDEEDKRKILRDKLSGRSLFGVIISESAGMELSLYKRERVKETSRHLRYEEAVGSTGQSQGIYILLIIAIINYIARMYSTDLDDRNITKTIFIDNPFGAAKDVYIWEPILSMLQENNVQLIVPTRGVSPAMTSKFDVYYTLGQDMIGNKLQTVVTRFRSDIKADELEYVKIEAEQLDLFSAL